MQEKLHIVKWGVCLSVLTVLLGFILGAAMGGGEKQIKDYWKDSAGQVLTTVYNNDQQKAAAAVDRSWTFLKRAHMHAAAIGAAALVMIWVAVLLHVPNVYKQAIALSLGLGSLGYSLSWLFTAFKLPAVGSVPAAKASIHILAAPSIGLLLLGTAAVLGLVLREIFVKSRQPAA